MRRRAASWTFNEGRASDFWALSSVGFGVAGADGCRCYCRKARIGLEAVEQGMAVRNTGTLLGVPRKVSTIVLGSRSSLIGFITLDVKCA